MGFKKIIDKLEDKLEEYEKELDEDEVPPWYGQKKGESSDGESSTPQDTDSGTSNTTSTGGFGDFDLEEGEDVISITIPLPGVPEDQIEITLRESVLVIEVEGTENREERTYEYELPNDADPTSISADYENGLLEVTVDRS